MPRTLVVPLLLAAHLAADDLPVEADAVVIAVEHDGPAPTSVRFFADGRIEHSGAPERFRGRIALSELQVLVRSITDTHRYFAWDGDAIRKAAPVKGLRLKTTLRIATRTRKGAITIPRTALQPHVDVHPDAVRARAVLNAVHRTLVVAQAGGAKAARARLAEANRVLREHDARLKPFSLDDFLGVRTNEDGTTSAAFSRYTYAQRKVRTYAHVLIEKPAQGAPRITVDGFPADRSRPPLPKAIANAVPGHLGGIAVRSPLLRALLPTQRFYVVEQTRGVFSLCIHDLVADRVRHFARGSRDALGVWNGLGIAAPASEAAAQRQYLAVRLLERLLGGRTERETLTGPQIRTKFRARPPLETAMPLPYRIVRRPDGFALVLYRLSVDDWDLPSKLGLDVWMFPARGAVTRTGVQSPARFATDAELTDRPVKAELARLLTELAKS